MTCSLSESLEDYLMGIFIINRKKGVVRLKDIAKEKRVKLPSAVNALKELSARGLIVHEKYGYVSFTEEGLNEAKKLYERHKTIFAFLHQILGVNEVIAEKDAHKIEHDLTKSTLELLTKFIEFTRMCPGESKPYFIEHFRYFINTGKFPEIEYKGGIMEKTKELTLNELKIGESGRVIRIEKGIGTLKGKLLGMGAVPGTIIKVEKVAPLGDPIDISILGYHLTLRREEAKKIIVRRI